MKRKFVKIKPSPVPATPPANGKASKAQQFALDAEAAGWEVGREIKGTIKTVTAIRGDEILSASWDGERALGPIGVYRLGEHSHPVANAASARRILAASPDVAAQALSKASAARRKVNPASAAQRNSRPLFDVAADSDEEILAMIVGRRVTWLSALSGEIDSGVIPVNGKKTTITGDAEDRQLTFCDAEGGGYRTVRLSSISTVSPEMVDDGHMITLVMARAMQAMREPAKAKR